MYSREERSAYMRKYRLRRRIRIIEYLGGKCADCGAKKKLHCDHKDHTDKSFSIASSYDKNWDIVSDELKKCQLLCEDCHMKKTKKEGSLKKNKKEPWNKGTWKHGLTGYTYGCRCDICKKEKSIRRKK